MKIRTLGWLVGLSAAASSFLSCTQAKTVCTVGHAGSFVPYVVQFFNPSDSPSGCAAKTANPNPTPSLIYTSLSNTAANADPPRGACKDSDDGKSVVLVSDPTKPCDPPACAADTDCNSKHCDVTVSCKDDMDCKTKCVNSD